MVHRLAASFVSWSSRIDPRSCLNCPRSLQNLSQQKPKCNLPLINSLKFGIWQGKQWISDIPTLSGDFLSCLRSIHIIVVGDSTSKHFAASLRKSGVLDVTYHDVWGLKKDNIKFAGIKQHEPATLKQWFRLISDTRRAKFKHSRNLVILNSGIHDIARDNLFASFAESLKSLKTLLMSSKSNKFEFVWRLSNSVHESVISDRKIMSRTGYKNTMTTLRNEVNTFLAAKIMLPEIIIFRCFSIVSLCTCSCDAHRRHTPPSKVRLWSLGTTARTIRLCTNTVVLKRNE